MTTTDIQSQLRDPEVEAELRELHREIETRTRSNGTTQLAAFFALLVALAAMLGVAFKLDGTNGTAAMGQSGMASGQMAGGTASSSAPSAVALTIQHVQTGCHVLAVSGGTPGPDQTVQLASGGTVTITNSDVMPHTLKATGGPTAKVGGASMNHMNARSTVTFGKPGTYTFATKAGEDYPSAAGIQTIGPDNQLSLTVVVS